jgi:HD superfamily phosphodiesterase
LDDAPAALGPAHPAGACDPASVTADRRARLREQLAHDLEIGDPYAHAHSRRVARRSARIAARTGLDAAAVARVRTAAAVHDVGRLRLPRGHDQRSRERGCHAFVAFPGYGNA